MYFTKVLSVHVVGLLSLRSEVGSIMEIAVVKCHDITE